MVRGKENPTNQFDLMDIVKIVPTKDVIYDASIFGGDLGPAEVKGCAA